MPRHKAWPTLTVAGAVLFVLLLLLLHVMKPDVAPSWRFISEYALGRHGWLMTLAFAAWGASYLAAAVGVRASGQGLLSWVGAALLAMSGLSVLVAAVFPTDPLDLSGHSQPSFSGGIHNAAGAAGLLMPLAIAVATYVLRRSPGWRTVRVPLTAFAVLALLGFVLSFGSLALLLSASGGRFGPDVPVGWPNRLEVLGYSAWLIVLGWSARRVDRET